MGRCDAELLCFSPRAKIGPTGCKRFFSPQRKPYIALERAPLAALNRPGTSSPCGPKSPRNEPRLRPYIALEQAPLAALYRPRTRPASGLISPSNKPPLRPYIALKQAPYIALEQGPLAALYRPRTRPACGLISPVGALRAGWVGALWSPILLIWDLHSISAF